MQRDECENEGKRDREGELRVKQKQMTEKSTSEMALKNPYKPFSGNTHSRIPLQFCKICYKREIFMVFCALLFKFLLGYFKTAYLREFLKKRKKKKEVSIKLFWSLI